MVYAVYCQPVHTGFGDGLGDVLMGFYFFVLQGEDQVPYLCEDLFGNWDLLLRDARA